MNQMLARLTMGRAIILGLILSAFYYFVAFDSGMTRRASLTQKKARMAELETQLQEAQRKLDAAAVYKKTAAEVGDTINKLVTLIPTQFGMSDLMRIVSNEAKAAGSSLMQIEPKLTESSTVAPEFEELSVGVDLQGSFLQHMVFLSNLTKINQILVVRKFNLSHVRDGKGDEAPVVRLTADIIAFRYRKIKEPAPGGAQ